MLCYRDRTWCSAICMNTDCDKNITEAVKEAAKKWWGGDDPPFSMANFKSNCKDYK